MYSLLAAVSTHPFRDARPSTGSSLNSALRNTKDMAPKGILKRYGFTALVAIIVARFSRSLNSPCRLTTADGLARETMMSEIQKMLAVLNGTDNIASMQIFVNTLTGHVFEPCTLVLRLRDGIQVFVKTIFGCSDTDSGTVARGSEK